MAKQDVTLNIKALFDTSDIKNKVGDLQSAFKNVKLPDNLSKDFNKAITDLVNAANDFESKASKKISTKADAKSISKSIDNVLKNFTKVEDAVDKIQSEINNSIDLSNIIQLDDTAIKKISKLREEIKDLRQQIGDITTGKIDEVNTKLANIKSKGAKAGTEKAIQLFNNGEIEEALELLEKVKQKQEQIANPESKYNSKAKNTATENIKAIAGLIEIFTEAQREVSNITDEINNKTEEIGNTAQQSYQKTTGGVNSAVGALKNYNNRLRETRNAASEATQSQAEFNSELDSIKSRISYFFGLNNAIQLVKRTIHDAYETIKSLDKAMTETAVVTDFSIGDMWAQLPEYTKRANELGITTQAAYEAATLYYQQGLKTNEVIAISNETLKMARIAGLDAAEATDRMTNALRGFNMEITEANAQRIDDVYSRLAAISASNVDEISTAMTKVASLAHNAGAEFETTAAFLAQIIETTRESAETAGTALKTVYARFTEVKSLYSEGDLKGQDDEGEIIDINRVSQALRTAGIDLNRFFLGEVGIDDIFMELASKWKSLTTLQQRYIATQAAGSRQQSRFIALMSDYARTQELVGEAYNANGAAAKQFAKTQDSLESKLARLKNAWNEFAMGITNSDVIKWGVDRLTDILTIVNSLTTGFGTLNSSVGSFISTFAKLAVLSGTLKIGKGLLGTSFGVIGAKLAGTQIDFKQLLAQNMGRSVLGTLISGQGAKAAGAGYIGKHLAGAGYIGKHLAGAGIAGVGAAGVGAAGAGSLVAPLLAIAAAVGAIVWGYKQWEKYTPEGQVKAAKRLAKEQQEAADTAKITANNYKNLEESYKNLSEQINSTIDSSKRSDLIEQRNQAVLDAIKAEPSIGQYASVERQGLEIVVTIDEESFEAAAKNMADTAQHEERVGYAYNAKAELEALQGELARISLWDFSFRREQEWVQNRTETEPYIEYTSFDEKTQVAVDRLLTSIDDVDWGEKYPGKLLDAVNSIFTHQANAQLSIGQYYGNLLKNSPLSDDISNLIIGALGQAFNTSGKMIDDEEAFYEFANQVNGDQEYQQLLNFFAGNFGDLSNNEIDTFISNLSKTEGPLSKFSTSLDIDAKSIKRQIDENRKAENARRQVIVDQLRQRGLSSTGTPSQDELLLSMFTNAEKVLNANELSNLRWYALDEYYGHLSIPQEEAQEITDFFSSIDLNDPIKAFDALAKASKSSNQYISSTAKSLLQLSKFDEGNLTQIFLTSDEYSKMSEEIQDLIEKNGELSESDIDSLSQKYKSLDILINKAKVSTRSLAKAFTLVESGKASIEAVTTSFLKVLDNSRTFEDILDDIGKAINDFNNINTAGKTIDSFFSLINQFGENVNEKGRLSPELAQTIFGRTFDSLEEAKTAYELLNSFAENDGLKFFTEAAARGSISNLIDLGNGKFDWDIDDIGSYSDLIEKIKQAGHNMGLDMSDALAEYMIASFYEHGDTDFREAIDQLNSRDMFKSILDEFNNQSNKFLTAAQIEAMAAEVGLDPDTFWTQLSDYLTGQNAQIKTIGKYGFEGNPIVVDDLVEYFRQSLGIEDGSLLSWKEILGDRFLKGDETEGYTLNIPNLKLAFGNLGFTDEESAYTFQKLDELLSEEMPDRYKSTSEIELSNLAVRISSISGFTFGESVDLAKKFGDDLLHYFNNDLKGIPLDNITATINSITGTFTNGTQLTREDKGKLIDLVRTLIGTVPIEEVPVKLGNLNFIDSNGNVIPELYDLVKQKISEYNIAAKGKDPYILTPKGLIQWSGITIDPGTTEKIQTLLDIYNGLYKGATLVEGSNKLVLEGEVVYDFDDSLDPDQIRGFLKGDSTFFRAIITAEFAEGNLEELRGQLIASFQGIPVVGGESNPLFSKHNEFVDEVINEINAAIRSGDLDSSNFEDQVTGFIQALVQNASGELADLGLSPSKHEDFIKSIYLQIMDTFTRYKGHDFLTQAKGLQEYETSPFLNSLGETIETFLKSVYIEELDLFTLGDEKLEQIVSEINRIYFAALTASAEENADANSVQAAAAEAAAVANDNAADAAMIAGVNFDNVATAAANAAMALNGIQPTNASNASGGIIKSHLTSLTGEEAPEIVWNKKKGYSYITGQNGPEFRELQPGDQVFDAAETKKILRNSRHNLMGSFAKGTGYWNPTSSSGPGGTGSNSNDNEKDEEWKNELDWLYNLVEDIAELERIQTKLQEEYDDYLKDQSKNGKDLYNLLIKQLGNLYTQLDHQTFALEQREREMREFMDTTNKYDEYLSYNWQDRTLEIDWDAIEAIQDKDTYEEVKDLVSEAESIQDKMDDAEDSMQDIRNQIEELENIWRDTYVDFEERVLDAIVKSYQIVIDNYSELNDTLNNSNSEILNALQKQISLERQIRDNTKTEQDIADQEARLAFLRRDTTGSNELSALQLSSQLDESREAYEDNLIDQAIAKLQEDNDEAAAQRQKQIEIMQAQLDYQSENGEFNAAIRELLESAMDSDGKLLTDSELYKLLQSQENWQAMSEVSKQVWEEELQGTFKEVAAFILKQNAQENGTYITALTAAITSISSTIGSYSQALTKMSSKSSSSSNSSGSPSSTDPTPPETKKKPQVYQVVDSTGRILFEGTSESTAIAQAKWYGDGNVKVRKKYATGGLASATGLAWLDGTPSEPEYVLNARQTDAFLQLADILPSMMQNGGATNATTFGGVTLNLVMNVDQIASDYDVDRIADRVKSIIYDAGSYRNVNTLNFSR